MDPVSLSVLGALALSEGVKFLYGQAGEVLKRWRENRANKVESSVELPSVPKNGVLDADLASATVPVSVLEQHAQTIASLRRELLSYMDEGVEITSSDDQLLARVESLRAILELLYGQRLSLVGERRERTGTRVDSRVVAGVVEGHLAGLSADSVHGDVDVSSTVRVEQVAASGTVIGAAFGCISERAAKPSPPEN